MRALVILVMMVGYAMADLQAPSGLRLAGVEDKKTEQSITLRDSDSGKNLHVLKLSVITIADIKSAKVEKAGNTGLYQLSVELKDDGSKHLRDYTAGHQGKRLAIVVNNRLLAAPVIRAVIEDGHFVVGKMSQDEARTLADAINKPLPVPSQ